MKEPKPGSVHNLGSAYIVTRETAEPGTRAVRKAHNDISVRAIAQAWGMHREQARMILEAVWALAHDHNESAITIRRRLNPPR